MPSLLSALEAYRYCCSCRPKTKRERDFKAYGVAKSKEDIQVELDAMIIHIREQIMDKYTQELLIVSFKNLVNRIFKVHNHEETL